MYKPFEKHSREIRLLKLHSSKQFSSKVQCSLFTVRLEDAPNYTALSYCWGDASNPHTIGLDDASLSTTSNLYSALQQIRSETEEECLWVDAICINQKDDSEKGHQVLLMRDLYERAAQTIVWLGESAENSDLAFELIAAWSDAERDYDTFLQRCTFAFEEKRWEAVGKLAKRPWWKRVWVCQEFVVSKQVVFLCGADSLSQQTLRSARMAWESFSSSMAATNVDRNHVSRLRSQELGDISQLDYLRARYEVHQLKRRRNQCDEFMVMDLPMLISFTADMQATDDRDRLYALLGLDQVRDMTVTPDYKRPLAEVYTSFAVDYIETKSTLEILGEAGIGFAKRESDMPSWVPDLRTLSKKGQNLTNNYNCAAGVYGQAPKIDRTFKTLLAWGFACDKVADFRLPVTPWNRRHEQWAELL